MEEEHITQWALAVVWGSSVFLLPLQGGGRVGDGLKLRYSCHLPTTSTHPHPSPPLEGEGVAVRAIALPV